MRCRSVMTNTVPTAPFRGAGRPEATLVLERLIDLAADKLGIDRLRDPPEERHPEEEAALSHRQRAALRQRRLRRQHEAHDRGGRLEGLCRAPARIEEARQAPRHRHLQLSRNAGRHSARARRSHRARRRQGRACGRHAIDRPRPRDELRPGDGGSARRASGGHRLHRRRHRENSVRQRHPFRPLDAARRHADVPGVERRGGAGQGGGGEDARSARGRDRFHRRAVRHAEQQPAADDLRRGAGDGRQPRARRRPEAAIEEDLHRPHPGLSDRLRDLRGRDRSGHRRDQHSALRLDRRRRTGDQPAHPARPGAWRHRPGHRPGAGGGRALRRGRPGADRQLHGLRHPARASGAVVRHRADRRPDQGQSAARQGRRRSRHHAGAGGGDERDHGCAEGLRRRAHGHAGDAAPDLECDPGGEREPQRQLEPGRDRCRSDNSPNSRSTRTDVWRKTS